MRISSSDFAASLDAAGGAGPVVDAPSVAPLVVALPEAAPVVGAAAVLLLDSAGFWPKRLGAAVDVGAVEEVEFEAAGCPSLKRPPGAAPPAAGAAGVLSFLAPNRLGVVPVVAGASSFFWPRLPNMLGADEPLDAAAGAGVLFKLPNKLGAAAGVEAGVPLDEAAG